jgi:hypothetical protein
VSQTSKRQDKKRKLVLSRKVRVVSARPCLTHATSQYKQHEQSVQINCSAVARTFQGMMAVKPGRTTTLPDAVNVSPPPVSTALVFFSTQSPAAARKARVVIRGMLAGPHAETIPYSG